MHIGYNIYPEADPSQLCEKLWKGASNVSPFVTVEILENKIFFWTIVRLSRPSHFFYKYILLSSKERYDFHLHFFSPAFKNMRQWPRVSHSSWLTRSLTVKPDISRTTGSCQWQKFRDARHTGKACQCQWVPQHFTRNLKVEQGTSKPEPSLVGSRQDDKLSQLWGQ